MMILVTIKKRKGSRHPANGVSHSRQTYVTRRDLCAFFVMYLYIVLYCVFVVVYMSDQITLNYVVCIYFASPGASHLFHFVLYYFVVKSVLTPPSLYMLQFFCI